MTESTAPELIELSPRKFLIGCVIAALLLFVVGLSRPLPPWFMGLEVLLTILALFVLGSIRYRLDKNALTYGAGGVIAASFLGSWWPRSALHASVEANGPQVLFPFLREHLLTLHGLEDLIHADTMLFILGLTFFVAMIAQTRLLESLSFVILGRFKGAVVPTLAVLTGVVSFASGILDGVSMIGLLIRTMVIILLLASASERAVIFSVIVSTIITTVCGMWLAYGEPPNLIMKSNLRPHLTDAFFLRYCLPMAVASFLVVLWNLATRLKGKRVDVTQLDVLDVHLADVRFLQAMRHGEVLTPNEFLDSHRELLAGHDDKVTAQLSKGVPLGEALVVAKVPEKARHQLLGMYVSEPLAEPLDEHYVALLAGRHDPTKSHEQIERALESARKQRAAAQKIGLLAFIPFVGFLVLHGVHHEVPLFLASFAAFGVAFIGISRHPKMRKLALTEAKHEFAEYLFLLPLFLSIALLKRSGFFDQLAPLIDYGIHHWGSAVVAIAQFWGATILSAMLDNNVVADFASHMLHHLDIGLIHLFSMAQIAGYALGGCWTHIGSAQSVVAYSFVQKEIDPHYTPLQWIKAMTKIVLEIAVVAMILIFIESRFAG